MSIRKLSLRLRIFISMILLVLIASIVIAAVTIYQYNEEAQDYHKERLERKEENIRSSIDYTIRETTYPVSSDYVPLIFKDEINKIAEIHKLQINLYDIDGTFLKSSKAALANDSVKECLAAETLNAINNTSEHRYVQTQEINDQTYQSSYSYVTDRKFKPIAILNLTYVEDNAFLQKELVEFLQRLSYAYVFMILMAIFLAFLLSKYITRSLKTISDKINSTRLERKNQKINIATTSEISTLVSSYNSMIDELEESAVKLATGEREQAWREMAKQVAHEIKNPLTPMRLTVQSFQRKFDPQDPNIRHKLDDYSKTLIQQIDTMSSIASAFSNFADMPAQKNETLNVVQIVKLALDIFNEDYIVFMAEEEEIIAKFDRTQLIRVVTNLVKNGIQAIPKDSDSDPNIVVQVSKDSSNVIISVADNGIGITEENKSRVFEPKFTTKSSGMGLGLAMVKNIVETYKGNINFTSESGKGTVFTVLFPREA